jgi:hypothetical protein
MASWTWHTPPPPQRRVNLLRGQQIDLQPKVTLRPKYPIHIRVEAR